MRIQNTKTNNYVMENYGTSCLMNDAIKFATSQPDIFYKGGHQVGVGGCNVDENSIINGNEYSNEIYLYAEKYKRESIIISAEIESQISLIKEPDEKKLFLEELNISESGLTRIIKSGYRLMLILTYYIPLSFHNNKNHQFTEN